MGKKGASKRKPQAARAKSSADAPAVVATTLVEEHRLELSDKKAAQRLKREDTETTVSRTAVGGPS